MPNRQGEFIWYELLTENADRSQAFYSKLLAWQVVDSGQAGMDYRILMARDEKSGQDHPVGGFLQLTDALRNDGARPTWLGYVAVDDADHSVERIIAAGGNVIMPLKEIHGIGRMALVADPQGALFYIMRSEGDYTSLAFASDRPRPGHCAWNELATADTAAAWSFYGEQFGWRKEGEMPMGELGAYEFIRHNGVIGAIMPQPVEFPSSLWTYYFRVPDIDNAAQKIAAEGGGVVQGPDEIPGGEYVLRGVDPQGALFALIGKRH